MSGVLTDEYLHGGIIGTTINHLVEGFVRGAAVELPRGLRISRAFVSPALRRNIDSFFVLRFGVARAVPVGDDQLGAHW